MLHDIAAGNDVVCIWSRQILVERMERVVIRDLHVWERGLDGTAKCAVACAVVEQARSARNGLLKRHDGLVDDLGVVVAPESVVPLAVHLGLQGRVARGPAAVAYFLKRAAAGCDETIQHHAVERVAVNGHAELTFHAVHPLDELLGLVGKAW